ncbi:MAG TPA: M1 family metallopeptidase, partial [Acidimicrobiales bacterium]|nr:M1 family metallopeptidase [Acidimicrobiales bacterium]
AFATFMELTTTDHFKPEWHAWTAFGAAKAEALAIDSLRATRPIEFAVGPPEEASAMFDVLTYEKGGSVLRMLEQYLGPEAFRKGIAAYLQEHQYSNTETTDLWDAIETSSGEPVRSIMDSWIFQGGYPIVSVEAGDDGRSIKLHQRRFSYDLGETTGGERGDGDSGERWSVPVNLRASIGGQVVRERALLNDSSTTVTFAGEVEWVIVNDGAWGFYRVGYSDELLDRLVANAGGPRERGIGALERMALVGDTWARVVAGDSDLGSWVSLVSHLGEEDDPDVWSALLGPLDLLDKVTDEADRPALQTYVRELAGPLLERLGWDPDAGEDQRQGTLRSRLIAALGILAADEEVRAMAARRFAAYQDDGSAIHPDLVTAVVHVVASAGGAEAYETMKRRLRGATTPQEEVRYLYALAQSDDAELLRQTLDTSLTDEVRSQDAPMLVGRVLANRAGATMAWQWIEDHWDEALDRFPANIFIRMVDGVTSLVDPAEAERARAWLGTHRIPQAGPRLAQLLEQMDINMAFRRRVAPCLAAALAGKQR